MITIKLQGLEEFKSKLDKLSGDDRKKAQQRALGGGILVVEKWAKINTTPNVDTGALRSSIQVDEVTDKRAVLGPHVHYAIYLEFGTVKMQAYPFLRPAIEEHQPEIKDVMALILTNYFKTLAV